MVATTTFFPQNYIVFTLNDTIDCSLLYLRLSHFTTAKCSFIIQTIRDSGSDSFNLATKGFLHHKQTHVLLRLYNSQNQQFIILNRHRPGCALIHCPDAGCTLGLFSTSYPRQGTIPEVNVCW